MRRIVAKSEGIDESKLVMTVNCRTKEVPEYFYDFEPCECNVIGCPDCDERARDNYDCGMMSNGLCTKAGSEDCDWDCPFNK